MLIVQGRDRYQLLYAIYKDSRRAYHVFHCQESYLALYGLDRRGQHVQEKEGENMTLCHMLHVLDKLEKLVANSERSKQQTGNRVTVGLKESGIPNDLVLETLRLYWVEWRVNMEKANDAMGLFDSDEESEEKEQRRKRKGKDKLKTKENPMERDLTPHIAVPWDKKDPKRNYKTIGNPEINPGCLGNVFRVYSYAE